MNKLFIIGNKIIVKQFTEKITEGGIIVPDTAKNQIFKGEIVGVGNKMKEEDGCTGLKEGDIVSWVPGWGTFFEYQGESYVYLKPEDIIGVE